MEIDAKRNLCDVILLKRNSIPLYPILCMFLRPVREPRVLAGECFLRNLREQFGTFEIASKQIIFPVTHIVNLFLIKEMY